MKLTDEQVKILNAASHKMGYARYYFNQAYYMLQSAQCLADTAPVTDRKLSVIEGSLLSVKTDLEKADANIIQALGKAYEPDYVSAAKMPPKNS